MKKILLIVAGLFLGVAGFTAHQAKAQTSTSSALTLEDIAAGKYSPRYVYGVTPMRDGESYSQLSDDSKRIIRRSFKDGRELGVVFDVDKARGDKKLRAIDGYIMSPDERRILLRP